MYHIYMYDSMVRADKAFSSSCADCARRLSEIWSGADG